ncbi:ribonuclease H-like domain-containing protein [Tanacetum coccineum]
MLHRSWITVIFLFYYIVGCFSNADWAGCPTTQSTEAVYCGVANAVAETCWLRNVLRELHTPLSFATLVYCDNVSVVYLSPYL